MTEAHARNMSISELVPFAQQELDNLQLVLAHPPVALAQLVERAPDVAVKAQRLDLLLFNNDINNADEIDESLDRLKNLFEEHNVEDLAELEKKFQAFQDVLAEFDLDDAHDLEQELKRLKKLAHRIEEACNDAGIEVTC